ncbi:MAG TPA: hypothetical protein VLI06_18305 [Solimonas sp.]|nr:hypothetical protein [Solimonas sp.]
MAAPLERQSVLQRSATPAPKPQDSFSPAAISRAVLQQTLTRPHVLYPTAIGLLGGLAAVVLGPATLFVAPAAIGLGLGLGSWALDYGLRRERHAADYLRRLQEALSGRVDTSIARLKVELQKIGFEPGLQQLEALQAKYHSFAQLLQRKLNPQEMTYSRYLGMTEQVFLAGLDNLQRISDALQGLSTIDRRHVDKRLQHLHGDGIESAAQDQEIAALQGRLDLLERQRERIDGWLAENERAMTQMDHAMAAIADLDTSQGHATMGMDAAMQELKALAERAQAYSSNSTQS